MLSKSTLRQPNKHARHEETVSNTEPQTLPALPYPEFVWGSGLECSFIPHLNVNQFEWTQHDRYWKEDLRRAKEEAGLKYLRYSLPWHTIETSPGRYNWRSADERVEEAHRLGLHLMLDVMHFGTPLWLKQAVGDPEFPESLERYTHAIVSRYRREVHTWCPCNEPLVCALFSGDFGFWPPHARKWRGYMPVLSRVVQGVSRGIRAIREAQPEAVVLLCDAAEHFKSRDESLATEVEQRNLRRFVAMDLLTGRVDRDHPLFAWLTGYGLSEIDLDWFRTHPQTPTVLGLDYYPHSDWQLDVTPAGVRQRRADNPAGFYTVAKGYYERYGLPLMLTETSIEGATMNREIWFEQITEQIAKLRGDGIPLLGCIWWPLLDQLDWDGALTHRIGKIHNVGLFKLQRQSDGSLHRSATPMLDLIREAAAGKDERVGSLEFIERPAIPVEYQGPSIHELSKEQVVQTRPRTETRASVVSSNSRLGEPALRTEHEENGNGGNGHSNGRAVHTHTEPLTAEIPIMPPANGVVTTQEPAIVEDLPKKPKAKAAAPAQTPRAAVSNTTSTHRYGIVVFSHLRWGFVWQRPQQFLSRFAKKHKVLFVEEPFFDQAEGTEPKVAYHRVMPNVVVACPHMPESYNRNPKTPEFLRKMVHEAIAEMNDEGEFDKPLLWYYSPMDSAWSLGYFENRGIVYDCMDELSQFTGAPTSLIANEARLMDIADVVFTGGYELWMKKAKVVDNAHFFGCGVEYQHFSLAQSDKTPIPPDIDFMARPIMGWFGVVDERVDYGMVGEMARMRPEWSFAMVGPVVKVDPNLLPHSPNLYWLGQREYQVLPNYCRAFDVCMMPFAINAATQFINPTKALEYFGTGRPVISTPVADVVRQYEGLVDIVKTPEQFIAAAERHIKNPDPARIQKCIERAKASSWENTVKTMQGIIDEAITRPERRSAKKPAALDDAVLSYNYRATQGS